MSKIKLAHMGVSSLNGIGTEINFGCHDYLLDYDFIVVSAAEIHESAGLLLEDMDADHDRALAFLTKRSQDLKDFYHYGGTLVLLLDEEPIIQRMEYVPEFGHGKLIDVLSTRPAKINYIIQHGTNVQHHPIASPLADTVDVYFKAILNHSGTNTLLRTQRTKQPISYHCRVDKGFFLTLPDIAFKNPDNPDAPAEVLAQVLSICQTLKQPQLQLA
jgi:hypothetical protein